MIIVLMGVAGSGKTTVGKQLSQELDWAFVDADDLHPAANKENLILIPKNAAVERHPPPVANPPSG